MPAPRSPRPARGAPFRLAVSILATTGLMVGAHSLAAPGADEDGGPNPTAGQPPLLEPLPEGEVQPFDDGAIPEAIATAARDHRNKPIGERISAISEAMMGTPYLNDATGEATAPDFDPPVRYDAFDCLTFVEEVLALALSADERGAAEIRNSLRYGHGETPAYENRQHFMLQQWVPGAIESGWLRDITAELGETRLLEKTVTKQNWQWWRGRKSFLLPDALLPTGDFRLQVLTPGSAWDVAPEIPDGAIVLTVRESKDHVPIIVTHLGFKVSSADPEKPFFRHATKMGKKPRVRNDWLQWYVEHNRWYHWWPVAGFTVLMPQEQGPRMSALADAERTEKLAAKKAAAKDAALVRRAP
jgi:hypothetical protein